MKLNNLKPATGSTHSERRIGRGPGSGLGGAVVLFEFEEEAVGIAFLKAEYVVDVGSAE